MSLKINNDIEIHAPAKVNLYLDIVGVRNDGYHLLNSVFQTVSLCDTVTIAINGTGNICIKSNIKSMPLDGSNTAYKAAELFFKYCGLKHGADIFIEKRIPDKAGLGGGSSDAAAVLKGLNELCGTGLSDDELCMLAIKIGADVPFFIHGGTAYVEGIGECITPLKCMDSINFVIAKGDDGISTIEAYRKYDNMKNTSHSIANNLLQAITSGGIQDMANSCFNVFEQITDLPDVFGIKECMLNNGAVCSLMSGSGSAVFGIFDSNEIASECCKMLKTKYKFAFHCISV